MIDFKQKSKNNWALAKRQPDYFQKIPECLNS